MRLRCPTCQETIEVGTLKALRTHIKKCGATPGTKVNPTRSSLLPNATALPALPLHIEIRKAISSQNSTHKKHWTVYSRELKSWRGALEPRLAPVLGLQLRWSRWHFLRLIPARGKLMDDANIVGGCKPIPDALQEFGVIVNDDPGHFVATYSQQKLSTHPESARLVATGILTILTLLEATWDPN